MTDPVAPSIKRPYIIRCTRGASAYKLPGRRRTGMQIRRRLLLDILLELLFLRRILVCGDARRGLVGRGAGGWGGGAGGLLVGGAVGEVWRRRVLLLGLLAGRGWWGVGLCGRGGAGRRGWVVLVAGGRGGGGWGRGELLRWRGAWGEGVLLLLGWGACWRSCSRDSCQL